MTTKEAKAVARRLAKVDKWSCADIKEWKEANVVLADAGICPSCYINDGVVSRLMEWQPGSADEYAGRECPVCEEFAVCGEQEMEYGPVGYDEHSDADPGL
jgi:hypothetical protein